jgi:hypothetical protein
MSNPTLPSSHNTPHTRYNQSRIESHQTALICCNTDHPTKPYAWAVRAHASWTRHKINDKTGGMCGTGLCKRVSILIWKSKKPMTFVQPHGTTTTHTCVRSPHRQSQTHHDRARSPQQAHSRFSSHLWACTTPQHYYKQICDDRNVAYWLNFRGRKWPLLALLLCAAWLIPRYPDSKLKAARSNPI